MKKEKVIAALKFYKDVDKSIRLNERVVKNLEIQYYNSSRPVTISGMPHGKGGTSSPIEKAVFNIPKSVSRTIREIEQENEKLEKVRTEIWRELNLLNYHQKAVILGFYIDGLPWERISVQTNYSSRQCRNIRDGALESLTKRFSSNKTIANYRFPE